VKQSLFFYEPHRHIGRIGCLCAQYSDVDENQIPNLF